MNAHARLFWIVLAVAFVIRAVHVLVMMDPEFNPLFHNPIMDAGMHDRWAQGILSGTWPGPEPFFRAPLYIYFLAGLHALLGADNRLWIQLVHVLISAAGAGLAALCADRLFGRRAGWLAGLLFAGLWTSIYFAGELLIVTLTTTLNLWLFWLLLAPADQAAEQPTPPGRRRLFLVGLVWGLSAIARPNILILGPIIAWYLYRYRGLRLLTARWLLLAAGLVLPILPVTAHNLLRGGDRVLIASQGGVNFYIGNNSFSDGRTAYVPGTRPTWQGGFDDVNAMAVQEQGRPLKPSEVDGHYFRKGLAFWGQETTTALRLYAHKLRLIFASGERSNNKNIYFWRDRSRLLRWPIWLGWAPILFLAVLGFSRRDLLAGGRFLWLGGVACYAFSILLFFINARFRVPILALMCVPAGGGLARLYEAIRARAWPDRWRGPAVAVALLLFSVLPDGFQFSENKLQADPFSWHTLGNSFAVAGKLDQARQAYERALEINHRYQQPYFIWIEESIYTSLGDILLRQGKKREALRLYRKWTRIRPDNVEARVRRGDLLLQAGQSNQAAAQYEVALRHDPDHFGAQIGHAFILCQNGDSGAALHRFEALRRQQPANSKAIFGAGLCLMELQRWREAEQAFQEVFRMQPDNWRALGNLAGVYEQLGDLDRAYTAYRKLLTLRPQDEQARRWLAEHGR